MDVHLLCDLNEGLDLSGRPLLHQKQPGLTARGRATLTARWLSLRMGRAVRRLTRGGVQDTVATLPSDTHTAPPLPSGEGPEELDQEPDGLTGSRFSEITV